MVKVPEPPRLVTTEDLPAYFQSNGIAFESKGSLKLGFGHGEKQYRLYSYPAPADDETMAVFCEWHTLDYFDVDSGPHIAIGIRGPVEETPHHGRGLAIGILANRVSKNDETGEFIPLFKGCPDPPGGPSFFIENFTLCDGVAPISAWQLSLGQSLPRLRANAIYRIDIHVSWGSVWTGVWEITERHSVDGESTREYIFLGQSACSNEDSGPICREDETDRGQGNAFIGTGFSDPHTSSRVENIYIAHWKNPA
jgi:hypothetical protein